jgi:GMP synthase-like glutamine amidotransferase
MTERPAGQAGPLLWVIDPSLNHAEDEGVAEVLSGWEGRSRLFRPALRPLECPDPESGYDLDGLVLMGSAASVLDDRPWIGRLSAWLRPILDGGTPVPVLGLCFGHQLVAHLAGSGVGDVAGGAKIVGIDETRLDRARLLPDERCLHVVVSHREEVKQAPAGYRVVARRPRSSIDGLEHERLPIHTFQFHPEARTEFVRRAGLDASCVTERVRADGARLLRAFRDLVTQRSRA